MTESSRGKFMKAVFGSDEKGSTIDTTTAAALLAATYSGGDPQIGENIARLLVPEMGDTVDQVNYYRGNKIESLKIFPDFIQNMMAALMSSSSMINAGATTEEVSVCLDKRNCHIVATLPRRLLVCTPFLPA